MTLYWGVHANKELSGKAKSLAQSLLQEYDGHISAKSLLAQEEGMTLEDFGPSFRFSGLHCASLFGIEQVVVVLIEMASCGINEETIFGYTPMAWAAENGHERVVEILLRREEADPYKPHILDNTPLSCAARNGHAGVVKILLGWEVVNPDKSDYNGITPL